MFPFERIVVALSGTETDAGLLAYAGMLAAWAPRAQFLGVHVAERGVSTAAPEPVPPLAGVERVEGSLLDGLLAFTVARRADLILLGHRRDHSGRRALARRLAMQAPCSVWMAPEGSLPQLRRVLVPVDYSRRAADALGLATALAEAAGLDECHALHVHFNESPLSFDDYDGIVAGEEDRAFCLFVARIDLHGIHVKPLFVEGASVPHAIQHAAAELHADLVVMGTRGRTRSASILLGSETEQTIRETRLPLLAVKHFGERLRLVQVLLDRRLRDRGGLRFS